MNECRKNSEVAPGRVDFYQNNWQSVLSRLRCYTCGSLGTRIKRVTGNQGTFRNLGTEKTQVSGSPMNQKNGTQETDKQGNLGPRGA